MISHKHKVIFVHVPKTAGQSVEQMFLEDLGLGWDDRATLLLQRNGDSALGPERLAHLYGDEYVGCGHISQAQFDRYLKFAIVRHPTDRIVSEYLYRYQRSWFWQRPSPEAFLATQFDSDFTNMARHLVPQTRYLCDASGKMLVDRVIRFENLATEIPAIAQDIFGDPRPLPYRNKTRKSSSARKTAIRARMEPVIRKMFASDFDAFDYAP